MKENKFLNRRVVWGLLVCAAVGLLAPGAIAQQLTPDKQQEVDALSQQMKANPNDYSLYAKRGFIYKKAGKESAANMDFEQALTLNPQWQQGYFLKGDRFKKEHRLEKALEQYNKADRLSKLKAAELIIRGGLYWDLKNYAAANEDYSTAIKIDPMCADAYGVRAALNLELHGSNPQSIADLEKTIKLNPADTNALKMLKKAQDEARAR